MWFSTKCCSGHILPAYRTIKDLKNPLYMTFNLFYIYKISIFPTLNDDGAALCPTFVLQESSLDGKDT